MIFDKLFGIFSKDLAIDLGTANTIVIANGEGIIINEPSVVALRDDKYGKKVVMAVGKEAKEMLGKTPDNIKAIRPMKEGVIADFDVAEEMIRFFIKKATNNKSFFKIKPRVIICVPYGLTQVERRAVKDSAKSAGAREVILIEEPIAAAVGAGLPIKNPQGNMVIDIGGGTTEIGVVSLDGLVKSRSIKIGGDRFDSDIVKYIKDRYNLIIGYQTAEEIKIKLGSATGFDKEKTMSITGRDIKDALKEPLEEIAKTLNEILEDTPPELASDIVENGIALTGGGALLHGIDKYLSQKVKLPVYVVNDPLLSVAKGTGAMLKDTELLKHVAIEK